MNELRPFAPCYKKTGPGATPAGTLLPSVTIAATDAAGNTGKFPGANDNNTNVQIQIANSSSVWAYVNFGIFGAVVAATVATGYPVAPGSVAVVTVDPEVTGASVILTTGGSGNVIFTRGSGT